MLPDEFSRSSVLIFEALAQSLTDPAVTDFMSDSFHNSVLLLLRGEKGEAAQQLLIDVSLTLDRRDTVADLQSFLRNAIDHLRFYAFRVLDQHGNAGDANDVLTARLIGKGGFIDIANRGFQEIKINVGHIAAGQNQDSSLYWRLRVKQFKYMLIDELKFFTEAARFIIETSASTYNSSASGVMNYVLGTKQTAEAQQDVLIKTQTGGIAHLSSHDLLVVDEHVLQEFLYGALEGADAAAFERRLQSIIETLPHLKLFEDVYARLSDASGRQWSGMQQITEAFAKEIVGLRAAGLLAIERLFTSLDYSDLPPALDADKLIEPFVNTTHAALAAMKLHVDTWLGGLNDAQQLL